MKVLICSPQRQVVYRALKYFENKEFKWAYFGEDISRVIAIEKQIGSKIQRIKIGEKLQEIAYLLRQSYIDYIGKLSLKNTSLSWWVNNLSEKNLFQSKVFFHICYIKACQHILKSSNKKDNFVFFVENSALKKSLVKNLSTLSFIENEVREFSSISYGIFETLREMTEFSIRKSYFLVNKIYQVLIAKYLYNLNPILSKLQKDKNGLYVIFTWVDHRSFDKKGNYRDIFFGDLASKLESKGKNIIIVPYILWTVPYYKYIKKVIKSDKNFLLLEPFLSVSDILYVVIKEMISTLKKKSFPLFEGLEISEIIFEDCKRNWIETRASSMLLLYNIIRRWKVNNIPIDTMVFTYENQIREKILCAALREFYPSTFKVGYQHTVVSNMYLNHFFSKIESGIMPFPDRVITSGIRTKKLFIESGYDPKKVVNGGALRHTYISKLRRKNCKKNNNLIPKLLVTPSIDKNESAELIWKVYKALRHSKKYQVIIKCHPLMPFKKIAKTLGLTTIPSHFYISSKPISELLKDSSVLIYTTSTTSVEALALGVPVLHIGSDLTLDMDILDSKLDDTYSTRSEESIIEKIEEILKISENKLSKKRNQWRKVALDILGPVNNNTFDLFMRPNRTNILKK